MIVVNFKTYEEATGEKARKLGETCLEVSRQTGKEVVVSPSHPDLSRLQQLELPVFSQHVDAVEPGSHTGHVLPEAVKNAGVTGTLLNHSERRISREKTAEAVERCKKLGIKTIVCAKDPGECEELGRLEPDYIAFEPPELIGGDVPVSEAKPRLIEEAVERSKVKVLTGAGIHSREDVEKSVELGCRGVLVASGIVKAENPGEELEKLCTGL